MSGSGLELGKNAFLRSFEVILGDPPMEGHSEIVVKFIT